MKKILLSLLSIGVVAVVALVATQAFFSDEEKSTGNVFQAGALDLLVDSEQHYNGNVCFYYDPDDGGPLETGYYWKGESPYPVSGTACTGTWESTNLGAIHKFFNFNDVKPGDYGENTISLTAKDNDAYLCAYVENLVNNDNGLSEPEDIVDDTDGEGNGELQNHVLMTVWYDISDQQPAVPCDNIHQPEELALISDLPINGNNGVWPLGQLKGDQKTCLGVAWKVLGTVGNEIQTDSVTGDVSFYVEQVRNNPSFQCPVR